MPTAEDLCFGEPSWMTEACEDHSGLKMRQKGIFWTNSRTLTPNINWFKEIWSHLKRLKA